MEQLNVTLDLAKLTLGDVEVLSDKSGKFSMTDKIEVLTPLCPGVDVRRIPVLQLPRLMELIEKELEAATNPL